MARDDVFRRSFEAGTAFLSMTRERAEALVKELVKAGDVQKGKAQKVIDELVERSRKGTEELRQFVRSEIAEQVGGLGLATKDDIARLEARLDAMGAAAPAAAEPAPPRKGPPVKKAGPAASAKKATKAAKARRAAKAPNAAKAATTAPSTAKARTAKKETAPARKATAAAVTPPPGSGDAGPSTPTGGPPPTDAAGG